MNVIPYILVMTAVTYAVRVLPLTLLRKPISSPYLRVLPLTLLRKPISSPYLRSFLYYVPYVTLAVMTFPAILKAAGSPLAGLLAFAAGILLCWKKAGLFPTAIGCCAAVFAAQMLVR